MRKPPARGDGRPRGDPRRRGAPPVRGETRPRAGWDRVAAWYDKLVGDEGSDYHRAVILPAALRLLAPQPGERLLDLCCGQGVLTRQLLNYDPAAVLAVDASPRLIAAAQARGAALRVRYVVRDVRALNELADGSYDAAACVMAVQDVAHLPALFAGMAGALRPGGRAALVLMHPCFRIPRQSDWGWDEAKRTRFRRVDRYASPLVIPIATHPGRDPGQQTLFYHRPLSEIITELGRAGLAVIGCEEPTSHRRADPGGHSRGENRAAEEIPVFLALKAIRLA